jgi:hypothetical protein
MSFPKFLTFLLAFLGVVSAAPAEVKLDPEAAPQRPTIAVEASSIRISGASPGAVYYLVGLGKRIQGPEEVRRYFRLAAVKDDDFDGLLVLDIEEGIPDVSLWAAVDRAGGPMLSAVPPGFPQDLPRILDDDYLTQGPEGPLLLSGEQLVVLYRRGIGAWIWTGVADVAPSGDPQIPDRLLLLPTAFEPLGPSDPILDEFVPEDLLFALDQRSFDIRRLVIGTEAL